MALVTFREKTSVDNDFHIDYLILNI